MMEVKQHKMLGEGTYGALYKAIDNITNAIVAAKEVRKHKVDGMWAVESGEAGSLKKLEYENIYRDCIMMEVKQHKMFEKIGEGTSGVVKALDKVSNAIVAVKEVGMHKVDGIWAYELREAGILNTVQQYKMLEKIGEGTSGVVYKALNKISNAIVAVKEVRTHKVDGICTYELREAAILEELQHENIVRVLDVVYNRKRVYLVLEYLDVNLRKYMSSCVKYSDDPYLVKLFLFQLLRGIAFCHSQRVIHRDLKPANLLIDPKSKTLKLADFGIARVINCNLITSGLGTLIYMPPEVLLGSEEYCFSADMWSIGCIFAEMVNWKPLFYEDSESREVIKESSVKGDSQIRQLYHIFKIMGTPKEDTWPRMPKHMPSFPELAAKDEDLATVVPDLDKAGLDLLRKMLSVNPSGRITAKLALEHEFFKGITFR